MRLGSPRPDLLRSETLADLFEATVRRVPDRPAVFDGEGFVSYGELGKRVAGALSFLRERNAKGTIVGLWADRGVDALVAQAALSIAGAAWLPLDADAPPERVATALAETGATLLVASGARLGRLPSLPLSVLSTEDLLATPASSLDEDSFRGDFRPAPTDLAYVITTSGTTGKPKCIAIEHRTICHLLRSENAVLGVDENDRMHHGFSLSFDMSFEEIWTSWLVGACLFPCPKSVTVDPDALAAWLESHRITALHLVPSMAALLPGIPSSLRMVNFGGEACPQTLADLWADGKRRVFNTYGPTETTVTATVAELRKGKTVTIGVPLPNYGLAVVDANGAAVPDGVEGELCIFGPCLARGYLGNEELTRNRFPLRPFGAEGPVDRCYRTGDHVRIDENGETVFLGRIDDQVKVRGFRVELGEIEGALSSQPGVKSAAVVLKGDTLLGFVATGENEFREEVLRKALSLRLAPYMIPSRIFRREEMPRLTSGKVDRKALVGSVAALPSDEGDVPANAAEAAIASALSELFPGVAFRRNSDFFDDLGGHSLAAAKLVSKLRQAGFPRASVGEVYVNRKLRDLAFVLSAEEAAARSRGPESRREKAPLPPRRRRILGGIVQALFLPLPIGLHVSTWLAPFFTYQWMTGDENDRFVVALGWSILAFLAAQIVPFVVTALFKFLVLRRLRSGRHPLWGAVHLRWWMVETLGHAVPVWLLSGTPWYRVWLRLLGARIGRDVFLGNLKIQSPDLFEVGDEASLSSGVVIANVRVEGGEMVTGVVKIGARAYVDAFTVLEGGAEVGADAALSALSSMEEGRAVPAGAHWQGSPAQAARAETADDRALRAGRERVRPGPFARLFDLAFYPVAGAFITVLFFLPIFPAFLVIDELDVRWMNGWDPGVHTLVAALAYFAMGIPAAATLVATTLLIAAALRKIVLPVFREGCYPIHGNVYRRKWIASQIQEASLNLLHGLFATIFAPLWFRLLGAKVGRNAEISTALGVSPQLLTLGSESFIADGVMLGGEIFRDGWMTSRPTVIGARTFVGNGAVVPDGSVLPDDLLIGVQTLAPRNDRLASGQTWIGSPGILLPARENLAGFSDALTFHPPFTRRVARGSVELLRIVLPLAFVMASGYLIMRAVMPLFEAEDWILGALALTTSGFAFGVACTLVVLAAKWILIGRYRPRAVPMWTAFVWVSEGVTSIYESLAVPNLLVFLRGTPFLPWAMRLFGTKVGRDAYLDTNDFTEFDCVSLGDGVTMNCDSGPQTHLFEDRIMKIGDVTIRSGARIGPRTIVLYDAEVGEDVELGPLSLVAKGERLPDGGRWSGSPASPRND